MTGLCIFMTLINVLATPEEIIKIYIQTKTLCHFNHTFIEKYYKNERLACIQDTHFFRILTALKS